MSTNAVLFKKMSTSLALMIIFFLSALVAAYALHQSSKLTALNRPFTISIFSTSTTNY